MDDLFDKKKDEIPLLDLSKTVIYTAEQYKEILEKVSDFKIKPEKVRSEDVKVRDKSDEQKSKTSRKEIRKYEKLGTRGYEERNFTFMNPVPLEMRSLNFDDFVTVPIEWRMLTPIRPKSKLDEEFFNRLVELGKSQLRTQTRDRREMIKNPMIRKTKNKHSGVTETRIVSCLECGEEFCDGKMCAMSYYDTFARVPLDMNYKRSGQAGAANADGGKFKSKRRIRRKPRSRSAAPAAKNTKTKNKGKKSGVKSDSEL